MNSAPPTYQDHRFPIEIVQVRRNTRAAKQLLVRLLKEQCLAPKRIITDKLRPIAPPSVRSCPPSSIALIKARTTGRRIRICHFESVNEPGKDFGRSGRYPICLDLLSRPKPFRFRQIKSPCGPDPILPPSRDCPMEDGRAATRLKSTLQLPCARTSNNVTVAMRVLPRVPADWRDRIL